MYKTSDFFSLVIIISVYIILVYEVHSRSLVFRPHDDTHDDIDGSPNYNAVIENKRYLHQTHHCMKTHSKVLVV